MFHLKILAPKCISLFKISDQYSSLPRAVLIVCHAAGSVKSILCTAYRNITPQYTDIRGNNP